MLDGRGPPLEFGCDDNWTWDDNARSHEVFLCDPHVAVLHPSWSNSTAGIRGTRVLNNGIHYWEISLSQRFSGTSTMFGIGKITARLHDKYFKNLLGEDDNSWGLTHKGIVIHGGKKFQFTEPFEKNRSNVVVGLLFNGIAGTLTYYKNGECLGVAFRDLEKVKEPLYPMVSSTSAQTKMILQNTKQEFVSLQHMCREVIAQHLKSPSQLDSLCLPYSIRSYLKDSILSVPDSKPGITYRRESYILKKPCFLP